MEQLQRAAVCLMSVCKRKRKGENAQQHKRKGFYGRDGKKGIRRKEGGGVEMGKERAKEEEIVTPRRRVQRQGNERLPALHHAQGLPQSAGGRGKMPHVSGLLALPLVCMHLGLRVCVFHLGAWCVCEKAKKDQQSGALQTVL